MKMNKPSFLITVFLMISMVSFIFIVLESKAQLRRDAIAGFIPGPTKKISDYQLVIGENKDDLEKRVKQEIGQGWDPHGGITQGGDGRLIQALIKYN
jgi:Domain of unknown function (DUF1737)